MNIDQYRQALKNHDWFYEYSDDHRAWTAGRDQREALRQAQRQIDPQGLIWNELAPRDCQIAAK